MGGFHRAQVDADEAVGVLPSSTWVIKVAAHAHLARVGSSSRVDLVEGEAIIEKVGVGTLLQGVAGEVVECEARILPRHPSQGKRVLGNAKVEGY